MEDKANAVFALKDDFLSEEPSPLENSDDEYFDAEDEVAVPTSRDEEPVISPAISIITMEGDPPEIEEDKDFRDNADLQGSMTSNKSLILQILSQIRIGMDLTRFTLPVFIFERRSLLEMYSEFFSHPDIIIRSSEFEDPQERIMNVAKWLISSISASGKVGIPKKPYNPILGEVFRCYWDVPDGKRTPPNLHEKNLLESGPFPCAGYDSVAFIAEQVSHHPPVSALYLECPSKRVYVHATIETKTRFTGLSVKVHNSGTFQIQYLKRDEVYVGTFPNGYLRSLFTTPWFEFGGNSVITCKKTGYTANIEFHTKPFRGGQKHRITGDISHASTKKPCMRFEGFWNKSIHKKLSKDESEVIMDMKSMPTIRKKVQKFSLQQDFESRVVWRHVTEAIQREDSEAAAIAKHEVEERQREKAREMKRNGKEWQPKYFCRDTESELPFWLYNSHLEQRMKDMKLTTI